MPIYAYRCTTCGHAKDVLRKMSDPLLTECPNCGAPTFVKQVTAAGFKLKGTGWYVTDFRDNGTGASKDEGTKRTGTSVEAPHAAQAADGASSGAASEGNRGANGNAAKGGASNGEAAKSATAGSETKSATAPASAPATGAAPGQK
jgi:putative FmdB family regulatory protein